MRSASEKALKASSAALVEALPESELELEKAPRKLLSIADFLESHPMISRAFTDPSRATADKLQLVSELFSDQFDEGIRAAFEQLAQMRLSAPNDLPRVLERLAVRVVFERALRNKQIEELTAELAGLRNAISENKQLRIAFARASALKTSAKVALAQDLFANQISAAAQYLLQRLITHPQGQTLVADLNQLCLAAAELRGRTLVRVSTAAALSEDQVQRLRALLERKYGQITLNLVVSPELIGGMRIHADDKVLDATVKTEFSALKQKLAG